MWWLACVLVLSALLVHLAIVRAHASDPPYLPLAVALAMIGVVLAGIVLWSVSWHRRFRPPFRSSS